jgi:DNA-binding PucR family transcriptional regulator
VAKGKLQHRRGLTKKTRAELAERLRERLPELQEAVRTRVYAIADPREVADLAYRQGLDAAVAAAIDYRLAVLELGERRAPAVPEVLLAQARLDARDEVALDTVLRRYFAGSALFGDFLAEEAERADVPSSELRSLLAAQSAVAERLIAAVSEEHAREAKNRPRTAEERVREQVKALLAGELVDRDGLDSMLNYDLDAHHLGLMVKGEGGEKVLRELAAALDRRLLFGKREEEPVWGAWLGGRSRLSAEKAAAAAKELVTNQVFITIGEPAEGLVGWRFSHHQAKVALPIAVRTGRHVLRYADIAVLAAIARDDLTATSLRRLYLEPLERGRDGGKLARQTLRAYFEADRNISSTAAALGVDRRTVRNRLRSIEELLGRPLRGSLADLEIALRLDE